MEFDWKSIVREVAPALATMLGGPLVGTAIGALSQSLLGKADGTAEEIAQAIGRAPPEVLAKIRESELMLKAKLGEIGVSMEDIAAQDRASARDLAKSTGLIPQVTISFVFVVGYFLLVGALLLEGIKISTELYDVFLVLIGVITGAVPQILNFWLGSTRSSQNKDAMIGKLTG